MGLQQSKPHQTVKQKVSPSNNYYGGQLTHNSKTNTTYQQFIIQEKYYEKFINLIKSRQKLQHQNFVTIKRFWKKSIKNQILSCENEEKIEVYVEYQGMTTNLSEMLDKLSQNGNYLPETQIRRIFFFAVQCLKYLQQNKTCHGDIKPQSIMLDNMGSVRLMDSFFINGGKTSYQIVMQNPSSMSYLSPQQLQRLRDKQFDSIHDIYNNQAFSLGLTMYECLTFERGMECYDLDKLKIKLDFFKGKQMQMLRNGYSKQLVDIVLNLVSKPAQQRMNFQQIGHALKGSGM